MFSYIPRQGGCPVRTARERARLSRPKVKRRRCREAEHYANAISISQGGHGLHNAHPLPPGLMAAHCGKPFVGTSSKINYIHTVRILYFNNIH